MKKVLIAVLCVLVARHGNMPFSFPFITFYYSITLLLYYFLISHTPPARHLPLPHPRL